MKTNKSAKKRIRVTANGKAVSRDPGKNHFNARKSRSRLLKKQGTSKVHIGTRTLSRLLPHETLAR